MARQPAQQRAQIVPAAFAEKTQQRVELVGRQRRGRFEPRVVAIFAGQHRERDAALARQRRKPLDAVFPPIEAAEEANHDHLGMRADAVDPQIDRHRMAQVAQMREPHARQGVALGLPGGGKAGEIAVGERQDGDVARRLAEIDRFDDLVEAGRARRQQMHRWLSPASARVTAARSSPFSPITTSRPWRVSDAAHGRSYWCVTRGPTAWTSRRSGLSATAAKPLTRSTSKSLGERGDARRQRRRVGDLAERHDERVEIVVVVLRFGVVPGAAVVDVVLGADAEAEQQRLVDLAVGDGEDFHAARQRAAKSPPARC